MIDWMEYLKAAVEHESSDVFFVAGKTVCEKREGHIYPMSGERLMPADTEQVIGQMYEAAQRSMESFLSHGDDDFSFAIPGLARFRVNTYRQRGSMAAVIRLVSFDIPDWRQLQIPEEVMALADQTAGMILITGTAGSGKTTTLITWLSCTDHETDHALITSISCTDHVDDHTLITQIPMLREALAPGCSLNPTRTP